MNEEIRNPDPALFNEDLKPLPQQQRNWNKWHLAALWVGMAVCIPTYMLASFMIQSGMHWAGALIVIGLANVIITLPMVLNGHAGVKYGIPFPVLGRAAFGTRGIYLPSLLRALVACGWFGVQTWIGGLSIYSIWNALSGGIDEPGLSAGEFVCFGIFWCINLWFILKGTESIKWLENLSAPFLILIGVLLILWGINGSGGFDNALAYNHSLSKPGAIVTQEGENGALKLVLNPIRDQQGMLRTQQAMLEWKTPGKILEPYPVSIEGAGDGFTFQLSEQFPAESKLLQQGKATLGIHFLARDYWKTGVDARIEISSVNTNPNSFTLWSYVIWLTAMLGFWATMSISISDITRLARSQGDQVAGQFLGLPGTMMFYSFVGIFVTCASVAIFDDILIPENAPWDPVALLSRFENPAVVIFAQFCLLVATLTTNIAANVIAPANVFSNLFPGKISFKTGGLITGLIGIAICPWWLMNQISSLLVLVSAFLAPVVGIMLCDYFLIRKTNLDLNALYQRDGTYSYGSSGINFKAMIALAAGVCVALSGAFIPSLAPLYSLAWFTAFAVSGAVYWMLMRR